MESRTVKIAARKLMLSKTRSEQIEQRLEKIVVSIRTDLCSPWSVRKLGGNGTS